MNALENQTREDIEIAIRIRDNCRTLAEKDALARLINLAEEVVNLIKNKK